MNASEPRASATRIPPELLATLKTRGYEPLGGTPADFTRYIDAELKKWKSAAKIAGVKK